jgi:hypothetical protein
MSNINEGSRGQSRTMRLQAAAAKAAKAGNYQKEKSLSGVAAVQSGATSLKTRQALRGGATPKEAKATKVAAGKRAFERRGSAIANFAAKAVARKHMAMGMKKIKPKTMVTKEDLDSLVAVLQEGAKRKARLLRAKMSAKNFNNPETVKKLDTAYDSELGRRVARKLRKGGAPKRTVVKFFNKDTKTSPAVDKAIGKFNEKELAKHRELQAKGIRPQYDSYDPETDALAEGSYVHSKGQLKKAIKGSKREIVKAVKKGDKKEAEFWMQNKKDAEGQLGEGVSAKRMRIIRKHLVSGKPITGKVADFMQRSIKKKLYRDRTKFGGASPAVLGRAKLKHSAMKAKGLVPESLQLDEAGYKKLMRLKGAAYKTKNPKLARAAAEQEAKVAARMAMKGGASAEAVKGGGSLIGKSGKYTKKAGNLANQRSKAIASFRNLNVDRGVARDTGTGVVPAMANRLQGNKPKMSPEQIAKKRESQAKMREYDANMRKGTFRTPEDPVAAAREKRPHYNYLKRTGQLKTK